MMSLYSMICCLLMSMKDLQRENNVAIISAFRTTSTNAIAGSAVTKNSSTSSARYLFPESFKIRIFYESTASESGSVGLGLNKTLKYKQSTSYFSFCPQILRDQYAI